MSADLCGFIYVYLQGLVGVRFLVSMIAACDIPALFGMTMVEYPEILLYLVKFFWFPEIRLFADIAFYFGKETAASSGVLVSNSPF